MGQFLLANSVGGQFLNCQPGGSLIWWPLGLSFIDFVVTRLSIFDEREMAANLPGIFSRRHLPPSCAPQYHIT